MRALTVIGNWKMNGSLSSNRAWLQTVTENIGDNPEYSGYVESGMILVGQTSGAQATLTDVRLISEISSNLTGSFFIPDPNVQANPKFETGNKVLTLINSSTNSPRSAQTSSTATFISSGTLETVQENILSIRNGRIDTRDVEPESRDITRLVGSQTIASREISRRVTQTTTTTPTITVT